MSKKALKKPKANATVKQMEAYLAKVSQRKSEKTKIENLKKRIAKL